MRRVIILLLLALMANASLQTKITESKKAISKTKKQIKGLNIQLSRLAKTIKTLQSELKKIDLKLSNLDESVKRLNQELEKTQKEYESTREEIEKLTKKHSKLKEQLVVAISNSFSKSLLLTSLDEQSQEDVLKEEILKALQKKEDRHLKKISSQFQSNKKRLEKKERDLAALEKRLKKLQQQRSELKRLKLVKAKKIKTLNQKRLRYDRELKRLLAQQKSMEKTLKRLQIIKSQQKTAKSNMKVKKYGSYKKSKTVRYRGPKTIAPLDEFVIIKRYGVYKDPIYNIEIPNENIELKPLKPNAKVKNVLNGKVILAKWTSHLKNVVIIKHGDGLYTIYANLDKLAPYIKKGRKVKKGYVIGRVNSKLIFEVTKNSAHINPLDLIRVK